MRERGAAIRNEPNCALKPPDEQVKIFDVRRNSGKPLSRYQRAELATGRQPRWSSSQPLIEDGLCDPLQHFEIAKKLQHPGMVFGVLWQCVAVEQLYYLHVASTTDMLCACNGRQKQHVASYREPADTTHSL